MKKTLYVILSYFLISIPSFPQASGSLFIIGGGERPDYLMQKFADLSGGTSKRIVIIPMASEDPLGTAEYQSDEFKKLGCSNVDYIICSHEQAGSDSILAKIDNAGGVFFSGGDQNNLTKILLNTKLLSKIKELYKNGSVIGGTSAGAAIMSKVMITGNELINKDTTQSFFSIIKGNVETAEGFGFIDNAIIDQHFAKRKRHNRLMSLVIENPELPGIGIDESTAVIVKNGEYEVFGESCAIVYDARGAKNIKTGKNGSLSADNIKMSIYVSGDKFNLK
jgi:cyanophycinase